MHMSKLNAEENLWKAFQSFDTDDSGFITPDELRDALERCVCVCACERMCSDHSVTDAQTRPRVVHAGACVLARMCVRAPCLNAYASVSEGASCVCSCHTRRSRMVPGVIASSVLWSSSKHADFWRPPPLVCAAGIT